MTRFLLILSLVLGALGCAVQSDSSKKDAFAEEIRSTPKNPMFLSDPLGRIPRDIFPQNPITYLGRTTRAKALIENDNCEDAEPLLRESIAEFQDDSSVWYFLAKCQALLGNEVGAITAYKEALSLGTHYFSTTSFEGHPPSLALEIARLYARTGDLHSAQKWLNHAISSRYPARGLVASMPEFAELLDSDEVSTLLGISTGENLSREEKWEIDIAYLREQVLTLHHDPDFKTEASELSKFLSDLELNIANLSDKQIAAKILIFAGMLGSGHDLVLAGTPLEWIEGKAYIFSDGMFFIDSEDASLIGAQILKFGDVDASDAFDTVLMNLARDNNMSPRWTGMRMLMSPDVLQELGIIEDAELFTVTIRDANGSVKTIKPTLTNNPAITPALAPNRENTPLYLSNFQSPIWYTELSNDAIYINVNTLFDTTPGLFGDVSNELSSLIESNRISNVVLDTRNSQGGSSIVIIPLIRSLLRFDTSDFKDNLYILIGRNTFSSAQILIGELDVLTDPIFVGEPSGGRQTFTGTFGQFQLPYSGITIGMPTELGYSGSTSFDHRIWIAPDVPIALSSEQYFQGIDPSIDAVLNLIEE